MNYIRHKASNEIASNILLNSQSYVDSRGNTAQGGTENQPPVSAGRRTIVPPHIIKLLRSSTFTTKTIPVST